MGLSVEFRGSGVSLVIRHIFGILIIIAIIIIIILLIVLLFGGLIDDDRPEYGALSNTMYFFVIFEPPWIFAV